MEIAEGGFYILIALGLVTAIHGMRGDKDSAVIAAIAVAAAIALAIMIHVVALWVK